jgi:uncharacterized protein (PEP-CTERM system associated)
VYHKGNSRQHLACRPNESCGRLHLGWRAWAGLLAATLLLRGAPCRADDWTISPSVALYGSYTSNASLNPLGEENPDFFTTLVPSIDIRGDTPRIKLSFDYSFDAIAYASNPQLDQIRNNLNFLSTLTLVPELFFLDGAATVQQVPTNGQLPVSSSPLAASTNLSTVGVYEISPYMRNHFGDFADSELRYSFNQVLTGNTATGFPVQTSELSNSLSNRLTETLVSGSQFTRLLWTALADVDSTTFTGDNPDTSSQLLQASAEYRLNRQLGLLASVGYERISDPTFAPDPEPDGPIGSVGVKYTPTPRTSILVNLNHRYNNNFITGSASYLLDKESKITASYTDQDYTSSQALYSNNLSFLTTDEFGNFIDSRTQQIFSLASTNFGIESDAFRQRSFALGVHVVQGRNTFDGSGYWQNRNVFQTGENDTAIGGAFSWGRVLSPVANVNLTVRYANENFDIPFEESDNQQIVGVGGSLVYHLNDTLDGILTLNYARQFADIPTNSFQETVLSLGLQKRF